MLGIFTYELYVRKLLFDGGALHINHDHPWRLLLRRVRLKKHTRQTTDFAAQEPTRFDSMAFMEQLPPNCPPNHAVDQAFETIYRLVSGQKVEANDFKSHAALKKENKFNIDGCKWASCSLIKDPLTHIERWPKLKSQDNFVAKLTIDVGSGKSHTKKSSNHVDFWAYAGFGFVECVTEVLFFKSSLASGAADGTKA